jgi:hypothetical protein
MTVTAPKTREEWLAALDELPAPPAKIPAFFFAHASPMLEVDIPQVPMSKNGALFHFLKDFGKVLVEKYRPKAIVVFSAHWETDGQVLGTRLAVSPSRYTLTSAGNRSDRLWGRKPVVL